MTRADLDAVSGKPGVVFSHRGLIDASAALEHLTGTPLATWLGGDSPYADPVILAPPWPEILATDRDRRHDLAQAKAEYDRLAGALDRLGHDVVPLPKAPVEARSAFVLSILRLA